MRLSTYLLPLTLLISICGFGQGSALAQSDRAPGAVGDASWALLAELAPNGSAAVFGQSTSVSGGTAVVGSWGDSDSTGAAYVFVQPSGFPTKISQTARLTASDGMPNDRFGYSVSISENTVIVGAPGANDGEGKAYVFVKPATGWTDMTETAQLTASDGQTGDQFGNSVSISGNTAIVGAYAHAVGSNAGQGAAYIFVQAASGWSNMTQTAELTASDGASYNELGFRSQSLILLRLRVPLISGVHPAAGPSICSLCLSAAGRK